MRCLIPLVFYATIKSVGAQPIDYPFGFQGMERDDEIQGRGNAYHTFYRPFDARRGTWSSVDPARSPGNSPYQAFANNPLRYVDALGDTVRQVQLEEILPTVPDNPPVRACPECVLTLDGGSESLLINPFDPRVQAMLRESLDEEEPPNPLVIETPESTDESEEPEEGRLRFLAPPLPRAWAPSIPIDARIDLSIGIDLEVELDLEHIPPLELEGIGIEVEFEILPPRRFQDPIEEDEDEDHE